MSLRGEKSGSTFGFKVASLTNLNFSDWRVPGLF